MPALSTYMCQIQRGVSSGGHAHMHATADQERQVNLIDGKKGEQDPVHLPSPAAANGPAAACSLSVRRPACGSTAIHRSLFFGLLTSPHPAPHRPSSVANSPLLPAAALDRDHRPAGSNAHCHLRLAEKASAMGVGAGGDVGAGKKKKGERASALAVRAARLNCLVSFVGVLLPGSSRRGALPLESLLLARRDVVRRRPPPPRIGLVTSPAVTGPPKVVRLSASSTKLQLEDVSDTLFVRPSLLADATKKGPGRRAPASRPDPRQDGCPPPPSSMLADAMQWCATHGAPRPRSSSSSHLYVHVRRRHRRRIAGGEVVEDVVFIHGFISSSVFWTETDVPGVQRGGEGKYRMFAVDLLGFGRSPKPAERYRARIVSTSSLTRSAPVLALALAVKYPDALR
ncbi:hypothetical protein HU200_003968 [Digitaria exilis]|uniref:AB hydrolase-1 domain-containing protein n=1 Tax=Digitaria exilis TaxID=1010633 RepID=A0A835FWR9_9POAL|nr:hypothetical protein HU200_003968 [Digitaria exilis]